MLDRVDEPSRGAAVATARRRGHLPCLSTYCSRARLATSLMLVPSLSASRSTLSRVVCFTVVISADFLASGFDRLNVICLSLLESKNPTAASCDGRVQVPTA